MGESLAANATGFPAAILQMTPIERGYLRFLGPPSKVERCGLTVIVASADYCACVQDALRTAWNISKDWTRTWQVVFGSSVRLTTSPEATVCCFPLTLMVMFSFVGAPMSPIVSRPAATIIDWFGLMLYVFFDGMISSNAASKVDSLFCSATCVAFRSAIWVLSFWLSARNCWINCLAPAISRYPTLRPIM